VAGKLSVPLIALCGFALFVSSAPAVAQDKKPPPRAAKAAAPKPAPKPEATKPAPAAPPSQASLTYEVAKGDTLFRIAGKFRHPKVTLNQMVLGLYRANPDAFLEGNINQLLIGRTLNIPSAETVSAVDPAQATQQLRALIAQPLAPVPTPPPPPPVREAVPPKPRPEPPPKPAPPPSTTLSPQQAMDKYQEGIKLEQGGDLRAAMQAYVAAGEAGYGIAQKRLGDIYNAGNEVVVRDYETALRWYQKARAQGVEIPKPITNPGRKP
jgi:FimV-like protein